MPRSNLNHGNNAQFISLVSIWLLLSFVDVDSVLHHLQEIFRI
jgi:hypothetical protein